MSKVKRTKIRRVKLSDIIEIGELASYLGVSRQTIRRWERKGIINREIKFIFDWLKKGGKSKSKK
ncbi:MAG: MerR family DNA-binding transcriptional regulator [Candidatus Omnitrophota bacterium]